MYASHHSSILYSFSLPHPPQCNLLITAVPLQYLPLFCVCIFVYVQKMCLTETFSSKHTILLGIPSFISSFNPQLTHKPLSLLNMNSCIRISCTSLTEPLPTSLPLSSRDQVIPYHNTVFVRTGEQMDTMLSISHNEWSLPHRSLIITNFKYISNNNN